MGNGSSNKNTHFLVHEKVNKYCKKKIDQEAIKCVQSMAEKMVQDIITRATLLAQHADTDIIDAAEICNVIDKNFDATFGIKATIPESKTPLDSYTEKVAEISKQK